MRPKKKQIIASIFLGQFLLLGACSGADLKEFSLVPESLSPKLNENGDLASLEEFTVNPRFICENPQTDKSSSAFVTWFESSLSSSSYGRSLRAALSDSESSTLLYNLKRPVFLSASDKEISFVVQAAFKPLSSDSLVSTQEGIYFVSRKLPKVQGDAFFVSELPVSSSLKDVSYTAKLSSSFYLAPRLNEGSWVYSLFQETQPISDFYISPKDWYNPRWSEESQILFLESAEEIAAYNLNANNQLVPLFTVSRLSNKAPWVWNSRSQSIYFLSQEQGRISLHLVNSQQQKTSVIFERSPEATQNLDLDSLKLFVAADSQKILLANNAEQVIEQWSLNTETSTAKLLSSVPFPLGVQKFESFSIESEKGVFFSAALGPADFRLFEMSFGNLVGDFQWFRQVSKSNCKSPSSL